MNTILLAFQAGELSPAQLVHIQSIAPHHQLVVTQDRDRIEAMLDEIEIAVCSFPHDLLAKASNLRWFQNWGAGVDWLLHHPELNDKDLIVTNTSGLHAIPISEHIFAFLLAFGRGFPNQIRNQQQQVWQSPDRSTVFELAGKTMLLIGVGGIGERTAQVANALGMEVIGLRRNPEAETPHVNRIVGPDALHQVLPLADFVVMTLPLTPETHHFIGAPELRLMKPSSYLVNIGRGGSVDQEALIQALQEKRIAGAGLDVTDPEPLNADSPLWTMENVIITAHYAGFTPVYTERALVIFNDNLQAYLQGMPLRNVVDKRLGY